MSSFNIPGIAASRARGAASPATDLQEPGAKRLRKRPAGCNVPLSGGAASGDVDAAEPTGATDGSATVAPSSAAAEAAEALLDDGAAIGPEFDEASSIRDLLVARLLLVLTRTPSFPTKSGEPRVDTEVNLGLVKAVEEAVEHAWRMRKADFPKESSLKPKLYACWWPIYFTRSTAVLGAAARGRRL